MKWMFVSLTTICHLSPLCHSFIDHFSCPRGTKTTVSRLHPCYNPKYNIMAVKYVYFMHVQKGPHRPVKDVMGLH